MRKTEQNQSPQENPYGLIGKIYEGNKKSHQSKLLSLYIGGALIITFLFLVSLAPQVGERLGTLAVKKQLQQSQAAYSPLPFVPRPSARPSPTASPSPSVRPYFSPLPAPDK